MKLSKTLNPVIPTLIMKLSVSSCSIEEHLTESASCDIPSFESSEFPVCQDLTLPMGVDYSEVEMSCSDAGGAFYLGVTCNVQSLTVGCRKTLSEFGFSTEAVTWFRGVNESTSLPEDVSIICEDEDSQWILK